MEPPASLPGEDVLFHPFEGSKRALFVVVELLDAPALFASTPEGEAAVRAQRDALIDACATNSYGRLALEVDYTWPPLVIPKSTGDYDPVTGLVEVRADALEAARLAGYAPQTYDREVIWSPLVWESKAHGIGRTVWMPHDLTWVLFHEFGHALAWGHANFWDGDPLGAGASVEYGDLYDPMGTGQTYAAFHHSGPWFKSRTGWLPAAAVLTVGESGTYALSELEHPDPTRPLALRIRRDANLDYWVFHRAEEPLVANGAVVVRAGNDPASSSSLLDMNPGSSGPEAEDAALGTGQVFDDVASGIRVENVSAGAGPLTLDVTVDAARQAALDLVPTVRVLAPVFDRGPLAGAVAFEAEVRDLEAGSANGAGIASVRFSILQPIQDPFVLLAETTLSAPPYVWPFDTTALRDEKHFFAVTATAADGGVRSISVPFLVDNGTGSGAAPAAQGLAAPRAAVHGIVIDARGRAAPGTRIEVSLDGSPASACEPGMRAAPPWITSADAAGGYALEGLPAGRATRWVLELPDGQRLVESVVLDSGVTLRDWSFERRP